MTMELPSLLSSNTAPLQLLLVLLALTTLVVDATFSIAAVNLEQQEMGAAGASCVFNASIYDVLYFPVQGKGILMTQAKPASHFSTMVETAADMINDGASPSIISGVITDPALDNTTMDVESDCKTGPIVTYYDYQLRQYGLIDLSGRFAGYEDATLKELYFDLCFTEAAFSNISYTQEHVGGSFTTLTETNETTFAYTAQGNIVALPTVPAMAEGFESTRGVNTTDPACEDDLVDRLYRAISAPFLMLEDAIAQENLDKVAGDLRCLSANQASAAGIFLHVEDSQGNVIVHIDIVNDKSSYNPFPDFMAQYEAWRAENPCGSYGGINSTTTLPMGSTDAPTPSPTAMPSSAFCAGIDAATVVVAGSGALASFSML